MNQSDKNSASQSFLSHQRRTLSVDEYSSPMLNNEYYQTNDKSIKKTLSNGDRGIMKQNSEDDYVCASLPRTNNRPSARTCWRNRPAFAPSPKCNFGPKGTLKKVQNNEQLIVLQDPSSQRLHWISTPSNILIIRKPGPSTLPEFRILVAKLVKRRVHVFIEPSDHMHIPFDSDADLKAHAALCIALDQENDMCKIDIIICLGGDGTLLHASNIFQKSCPPVLSFSMGSLGFLTPFDFKLHEQILDDVLLGNVPVLLRTRLSCQIIKDVADNISSPDEPHLSLRPNDKVILNNNDDTAHLALNEVVIDRGPNSYLSNLDLYINDRFITKVQGDGLIISTPTGSTAYAMAAGASMIHPNVPAMVICPICPHSLSFRPIVVPAGIELKVKVAEDSRLTAWLSVDGRNRLELLPQHCVKITTSVYPVPSICRFDQLGDWFESLADILHWNLRKSQLSLNSAEENQRDGRSDNHDDENTVNENENSSTIPAAESATAAYL